MVHFFKKLGDGLAKTRAAISNKVGDLVLGKKEIDARFIEELEEILITGDVGARTTRVLADRITERLKRRELKDPREVEQNLRGDVLEILKRVESPLQVGTPRPYVIMAVGVNGVGKTTTIGKLASRFRGSGYSVLLAAGDTFRAAAIKQLEIWGERAGAPVIKHADGADPSAVAYDAVAAAVSRKTDVVIIDTAGRLHTKANLMDELKKMRRVLGKDLPGSPHEILLVLDATTGQNALSQAKMFHDAVGLTGLVITKLDGTAKGGVVIGIAEELKIPIRLIGVGEGVDDLQDFQAEPFVEALFSEAGR
jgi:fused signal recognition particle receptor